MIRSACLWAFCWMAVMSVSAVANETPGDHVDDSLTTARVKMELLDSSLSDATKINVETSKGVVQLSGFVNSKQAKIDAAKITTGVEGVNDVSNRLTIQTRKRSVGTTLDDTILASKVKLAMVEDESVKSTRINIEVRDGSVELSGFVSSYAERDAAIEFVSRIDGVKNVINAMDVIR